METLLHMKCENGCKQVFSWSLSANSLAPGEEPVFLPGKQECLVLQCTTSTSECPADSSVSVCLDGRRIAEFLHSGKKPAPVWSEGNHPALVLVEVDCDTQPSTLRLWPL